MRAVLPPDSGDPLLLSDCMAEPETDIGNGRRLRLRHGGRILHVARVGWFGFDGRHWKEDEDGSVVRPLAQETAEMIALEGDAMTATDEEADALKERARAIRERREMGRPVKDWPAEKHQRYIDLEAVIEAGDEAQKAVQGRRSARHRFAKSSAGTSKINNMLTEAAPHVACMVNDLNRDPLAFNTESGTLRFACDGAPEKVARVRMDVHDPADRIAKLALVPFDPEAFAKASGPRGMDLAQEAPVFDRFLKTIQPNAETRAFLQRFFGYCLTGSTSEQCLLFFYGAGRNGKSTLVDLVCEIMGNYAITLSIDSFAGDSRRGGGEATPDLARLPGARLVAASEPEMGVKLKDALIKTLTGGEPIAVRRLHQDFIEVHPHFKIVLSGNHKPRIDDTSDGIWRRVILVPFDIQIPADQVDKGLPAKLRAESAAIFRWMVEGCLLWLEGGLQVPDSVTRATQDYREESDPIGAFIRSGCVVTGLEADTATPQELARGYEAWAKREGAAEFHPNTLNRRLPDYTRRSWQTPDGQMKPFWKAKSGTTVYRGIRVKPEWLAKPADTYPDGYGGRE
jgi:putative DNA primase/helicase